MNARIKLWHELMAHEYDFKIYVCISMPLKESICVFKALINKIIKNCKCYLDYIDGIQVRLCNSKGTFLERFAILTILL